MEASTFESPCATGLVASGFSIFSSVGAFHKSEIGRPHSSIKHAVWWNLVLVWLRCLTEKAAGVDSGATCRSGIQL